MEAPSPLTVAVWAVVAVLAMAACAKNSSASTHAKAPTYAGVCDFEHRMDIEIIDGVWWECRCYALAVGWDCAWQELPEPVVATKKRIKKHHARVVVRYALPAVTR